MIWLTCFVVPGPDTTPGSGDDEVDIAEDDDVAKAEVVAAMVGAIGCAEVCFV